MRIFRFTIHSGVMIGWKVGRARAMLNQMLSKYELSLANPGDPVVRKAVLDVVSPQTQEQLHATRGKGAGIGGSMDILLRTGGTKIFREITEGLTPKNPIISMQLKWPAPLHVDDCIAFMKRHNAVKLKDVLIEAYLISISPDQLQDIKDERDDPSTGIDAVLKLHKFIEWHDQLPPMAKGVLEKISKSWFYIIIRLDAKSLHMNYIDPFSIAPRLLSQYRERISYIAPIYDNIEGGNYLAVTRFWKDKGPS